MVPTVTLPGRSWAAVAGGKEIKVEESPVVQGEALEKLKASVSDFYKIDEETRYRAESRFTNALYGKFLGRASL